MKFNSLVALILAAALGWAAASLWNRQKGNSGSTKVALKSATSVYQCPMDPWVKSDKPGTCTLCKMKLVQMGSRVTSDSADSSNDNLLILSPGAARVAGIQTAEVKKLPLTRSLRVSGMIGEDELRHGVITAPVEGRLDGLAMSCEGEKIQKRQPVATIFSRTLLRAAADYKSILARTNAGAEMDAARKRLEEYGLVYEQIQSIPNRQEDDIHFGLVSRQAGVITKSYVTEGQYVKEGEKLFEIADFTRMWFMFTAYEQDLPFLTTGRMVDIHTPSLPGETLKGRIDFISPNLDGMTRSARVRVVLENPDRRIQNNIFATGTVALDAPEVLAIPRSAVIWPGTEPRVFVQVSPGNYEPRAVKLGRPGDSLWEIVEGVREGEQVVTAGNMLLDSQAQLDEIPVHSNAAPTSAAIVRSDSDPASALRKFLQAVSAINESLANDDLEAANHALGHLPSIPEGAIKTAPPFAGGDLKELRKAFLPWSQEISDMALNQKNLFPELHIFSCPMTKNLWAGAPANARWVQWSAELHNPYWGKQMFDCGVEVKP